MTEQEIKAWSMLITATMAQSIKPANVQFPAELRDWILLNAKPIADELRDNTILTMH